jgi:D-sedoheptulose 7-phosphate isomerase
MRIREDFEPRVSRLIEASISVKQRLLEDSGVIAVIARVSEVLVSAAEQGYKVMLFGNGGSAADAQHFAFDRPGLPALALSVNTSCVTAIGNDYGFDQVFSRQIEALGRPGDVAFGISTSGNSQNVLIGLVAARKMGLHTIGLTGQAGGKLKNDADFCICAPSEETPRIQECHILIGHIIAELVEETIFHEQGCLSRS